MPKLKLKEIAGICGVRVLTMKLTVSTIGPVRSSKGEELKPGVKVFETINLVATGKSTPDIVMRNVASFYHSTGLRGWKLSDILTRHREFIGTTVRGRVEIQAAGTGKDGNFHKARNIITEWVKR